LSILSIHKFSSILLDHTMGLTNIKQLVDMYVL